MTKKKKQKILVPVDGSDRTLNSESKFAIDLEYIGTNDKFQDVRPTIITILH